MLIENIFRIMFNFSKLFKVVLTRAAEKRATALAKRVKLALARRKKTINKKGGVIKHAPKKGFAILSICARRKTKPAVSKVVPRPIKSIAVPPAPKVVPKPVKPIAQESFWSSIKNVFAAKSPETSPQSPRTPDRKIRARTPAAPRKPRK